MTAERMTELHVAHTCGMCMNRNGLLCKLFNFPVDNNSIQCEHYRGRA